MLWKWDPRKIIIYIYKKKNVIKQMGRIRQTWNGGEMLCLYIRKKLLSENETQMWYIKN